MQESLTCSWIYEAKVEPRCNEPLFNEVLCIKNDFLYPSYSTKYTKKNLDITKARYSEQILPVHWLFVVSRFHCIRYLV